MATVGNVTCWRRTRHDRRACGELARAAPVNAEAVDHQERGGATKREKPGANAEKGGSRAHAEQRCQATTEHCAENADQQSAYLRRFGVAGRELAIHPATTPKTTQAAKPIALPSSTMLITGFPCAALTGRTP
jgi:hypothetical protein